MLTVLLILSLWVSWIGATALILGVVVFLLGANEGSAGLLPALVALLGVSTPVLVTALVGRLADQGLLVSLPAKTHRIYTTVLPLLTLFWILSNDSYLLALVELSTRPLEEPPVILTTGRFLLVIGRITEVAGLIGIVLFATLAAVEIISGWLMHHGTADYPHILAGLRPLLILGIIGVIAIEVGDWLILESL